MDFEKIVMERFAAREFDGRKVSAELLHRLFEIIRHAPSSYNIQPWKIKVIEDAETKAKLAPAAWNQPQITSCSHLLVFCADTDVKKNIDHLEKLGTPEVVVKMMRDFESAMDEEHKKSWAQRQVYLALANAVNGATDLGFNASPMEGFNPGEFAKILNLPSNIVPTALCAIGYAKAPGRPKLRFPAKDVFF